MSSRRVLWVSTSTKSRGGVATYVRTMQRTPLWHVWDIRHVATHRNGSVASRLTAFVTGTGLFMRELIFRRPALVHLHMSICGSFARKSIIAWIARSARIPVVIHVHGGGFVEFYARSPRLYRRYIRRTLERSSVVIALGDKWAGALQQIAPSARISVVPNAVEPRTPVEQLNPEKPIHVLFLGDIEVHKGAFLLLDAWSQLTDGSSRGGADLVMAGGGAVDRARTRAKELGITEQVQITGWIEPAQVELLLSRSHVLVLPSSYEGQPMAVLEAMAHGLCVVATDVGGVRDIVDDCGVLLPVGDLASLVDALDRVVSDTERRALLGASAFRRVGERFDVNLTWRSLDTLYEELAM